MLVSAFIVGSAGPLAALQDPDSDRWSADVRRGFLTDALREMLANHPETRVSGAYDRTGLPADTLATTDEIPVDVMFLTPLKEYVLFLCFSNDAKDEGNRAQAPMHLKAYTDFFGG